MDEKFNANLLRLETHCKKQLNNPNKLTVEEHAYTLELISEFRNLSMRVEDLTVSLQKAQEKLLKLQADIKKVPAPVTPPVVPPVKEPEPKPKEEESGW